MLVDYAVSGGNGTAKAKRVPFDLQLLVQNVRHGLAEKVEVQVPQGEIAVAQIAGKASPSDVDVNIPRSAVSSDKTFAVIIANEVYRREARVEFAANDEAVFRFMGSQNLTPAFWSASVSFKLGVTVVATIDFVRIVQFANSIYSVIASDALPISSVLLG